MKTTVTILGGFLLAIIVGIFMFPEVVCKKFSKLPICKKKLCNGEPCMDGIYRVEVQAKVRNCRRWDEAFPENRPPDIFGYIKIGQKKIRLGLRNDSCHATWKPLRQISVTSKDMVKVVLYDKDVFRNQYIGSCWTRIQKNIRLKCKGAKEVQVHFSRIP